VVILETSGFWAYGRLAPYFLTRFNVQEVEVAVDTRDYNAAMLETIARDIAPAVGWNRRDAPEPVSP
jgi:hypothetical protein